MADFTQIYNSDHLVTEGYIDIAVSFAANTLSVQIDASTALDRLDQQLGILYQHSGDYVAAFRLNTAKSVLSLAVQETDLIRFFPTTNFYQSYNLKIAYATIGSVIGSPNTVSIPSQITELPSLFSDLENRFDLLQSNLDGMVQTTWENLSGKPISFPPNGHTHSITDISSLSVSLGFFESRLTTLENNPIASSSNFLVLNSNTLLESNKNYYCNANNLICSLPNNPFIGDYLELVNGNFQSFRVSHGNENQTILNNASQTTLGNDSGIILKAYAAIKLVFAGSNLWVNFSKYRTVNNFSPLTIESSATQKTYSVSSTNANLNFGTTLNSIFNGVKQPSGSFQTDGLLHEAGTLNLLLTVSQAIVLDFFNLFNGQGNNALGGNSGYAVASCIVYRGNAVDTNSLLGTFTFANQTGIEQRRTINTSHQQSSQFLFVFSGGEANRLGILELELFGRNAIGGEVSVI